MTRTFARTNLVLAAALLVAAPASAQVVHSVHFGFGGFFPRSFDSRIEGDVLVEDLSTVEPLAFNISDFRSYHLFGEWNVAFGDRLEVGTGLGYYGKTVPSVYKNLIDGRDNTEIEQDLKLRIVPLTAVVRFLPFGRPGRFQPYIGAGVSVLNWRYSEAGEFVDTTDFTIFRDRYVASGTDVGPLVLGGIRMPIKGDIYALTLEGRYQWGDGDTGGNAAGFLDDKIDLGGGQLNFGFLIRF